ncbi:MAG: HAD-IIB family hydrolase [Campylobacterota bacterium]|nr:HAD-IIB family hydrolase [Campylobacterota bacterium]
MKPIYITDLDHTFLRSDLTISPYSQKVWNAKSREAILSVATARSFKKSHEFLDKLHLAAPMILLDGSMVVSPEKELIDLKLVNKALGDAVIDEGARFDIYPFVIGLKDMDLNEAFLYPNRVNALQSQVLQNYQNDDRLELHKEIRAMEMNLKIVYFGEEKELRPLTEHLQKTFGHELEYKLSPEKYSDGYFLTILHPHGDKAHALQTIAGYLKRDLDDFTVFGDSINDLGMFEKAGTAVAVQNALDEVKEKADIILQHTNDEDAVAKYLETLTLRK